MSDVLRIVKAWPGKAMDPSYTYSLHSFDHFIGIDGSRVKLFVQLEERSGGGHLQKAKEKERSEIKI